MKRYILIPILLLFFTFCIKGQIVAIQDPMFKSKLINTPCADTTYDLNSGFLTDVDFNNDGEIQISEALFVKRLYINGSGIQSLIGIEQFINLIDLDCQSNQLTKIDLGGLYGIKKLVCNDNLLDTLNIQELPAIRQLYCHNNKIKHLDLHGLLDLEIVDCYNNQLVSLDVYDCTNLKSLVCWNNRITEINLQGLINLEDLDCENNDLISIDIQGLSKINFIKLYGNDLLSLDAHGLPNLEELYCSGNQLTILNVNNLPNLKYLFCSHNQLVNLDAHGLSKLVSFDCSSNKLSSINLGGLVSLRGLFLPANLLENIDVNDLTKLESFSCSYNQLTTLDLRNQNKLDQLTCNDNQLSLLNIKNGHKQTSELFFYNNPLEYICCDDDDLFWVYNKLSSSNILGCNVNTYCNFTPGGIYYTITGENRVDLNGNGCDTNDINYPNLKFSINDGTDNGYIISNESGNYSINLNAGIYTIHPEIESSDYFVTNPPLFQVNLPSNINPLVKNFCISKKGTHHDVEIDLISLNAGRPGFDTDYLLSIKNKGTEVEQGDVNLVFDSNRQNFVTSNPVADIQIGDTLKWMFSNLLPFECRVFDLKFRVNSPAEISPVNIGDILQVVALANVVSIDENPEDNTFKLNQTVVGAFDPNDKTCLEGDKVSLNQMGNYLHYVIRFENTGTYPAENIVVKDIIDTTRFELGTLHLTQSSHSCVTRILHGNQVEFIFENIELPFSAPDKYGFVAFKLKTKNTLVLADSITNQADIFFDYNFPITTNKTRTTVVENISSIDVLYDNQFFFKIQPNPTSDIFYIECNTILKKAEVYDIFGRIVLIPPIQNQQINVSDLPNGTYFIKVISQEGFGIEKLIKN